MMYLVVADKNRASVELTVASLPASLARGCVVYELGVDDNGMPVIGRKVTMTSGAVVQETRHHDVMIGDEVIGTGRTKVDVAEVG
jgi:hypothetical protein